MHLSEQAARDRAAAPRLAPPPLQVRLCPNNSVHDWSVCPWAHEGERARRRDPATHNYASIACLNMKKVRR